MQNGLYGNNPEIDFEVDSACDGYQGWRNHWAKTVNEAPDSENVKTYLETQRERCHKAMEATYQGRTAKASPYMCEGAHLRPLRLVFLIWCSKFA